MEKEDLFPNNLITEDAAKLLTIEINKKKEEILSNRLKELGIKIDIGNEKKRRFNRFLIERSNDNNSETYYYNDGSQYGLKIITFHMNTKPSYRMSGRFEIIAEITYE